MLQQRRGRPSKSNHKVEISNVLVECLSKKKNGYNAEIYYMKTVDKDGKKKMRPITVLADEVILMPYWVPDKQDVISQVKEKIKLSIELLQQGKVYSIDAEFESYCIEKEHQEPIKGYFLKVPHMKSCAIEIDSD